MASVKFSRKEFEKAIKITPEIEEKIRLFGTPLESLSKEEVEIEIFPNRPDLLSLQGYIRAFRAFLGKEKSQPKYQALEPEKDFKVIVDESVKEVRPYTVCAIVKNLNFNDETIKEIIEMQEKLHATIGRNRKRIAIGIYPLDKIKLPIKYCALSPDKIKFRPLESEREMTGNEILQKHPTGKEYSHLLLNLEKYPIFMDASNKILSMPPIINSYETGRVETSTKSVFIECSGYDFEALQKTLNIITTTLAEMGGKIFKMEVSYKKEKIHTPSLEPSKVKISLDNTNKLLGLKLTEKEIQKHLERMGHEYSKGSAIVPAWRVDVMHEVDLIEDVAISYGYENLEAEIPPFASMAKESRTSQMQSKIAEIFTGLGMLEVSSYHLIKAEEAKQAKITEPIEVENSKTDYKILRPNLIIPALRIMADNKDHEYPQKIFEIGTIFRKKGNEILEEARITTVIAPGNFTEAKRILECLGQQLNISFSIKESSHYPLIEGRSATILLDEKPIGMIGEVHPETLRDWSIKMPVSLLDLSFDSLIQKIEE